MRSAFPRFALFSFVFVAAFAASAESIDFNLPAQPADAALVAFSKQAKRDVLFSSDELHQVRSTEVIGRYEREAALQRLLADTGFAPRPNGRGKYVITPAAKFTGAIQGKLLDFSGGPARSVRILNPDTGSVVFTDEHGAFSFPAVPPGTYRLIASAEGYQTLHITDARVESGRVLKLDTQTLQPARDPAELAPFVVKDHSGRDGLFDREDKLLPMRNAAGNNDLRRTEDDALPYTVYDRRQLNRSGVVNLNEFLQRELLDTDAATHPPEQDGSKDSFISTSANLSLRGYTAEETVILVNGRRLPEVLYSGATSQLPDVNFIPLSLVQQVEVLPVSAAALYTGNAVGGVINIVLRPDVDACASEVTTTYTNALAGYDAPQSAVSILHAQSLLGGKLRYRINASVTTTTPPTEAELGYHRARDVPPASLDQPIYRATPNLRSPTLAPLFGPGSSPVTSVAPGEDGTGGLAPFANRIGIRNLDFFDSPGGFAPSVDSIDYGYGRRQRRETYFGSVIYDLTPWLQLGIDATYSHTMANRGFDVLHGDLSIAAAAPGNPFHQDIAISLNETAPVLGENYSESHLDFGSAVFGALIRLPANWRITSDAQYAHSLTKVRGISGVDSTRWQKLVDDGQYNPLRDTQVFGPPAAFYDRALIYRGGRGRFVTLGNYDTMDAAVRLTNEDMVLPTGVGAVNVGFDYRKNHLAAFDAKDRYGDGSLAAPPIHWDGRVLQRYSVFGEVQTPLLMDRWRPRWLKNAETDLAVRYIAADKAKETNVAPTYGLKFDFPGGLSFRGSLTTSNRLPTPWMSHKILPTSTVTGSSADYEEIVDPLRGGDNYQVQVSDAFNPEVRPEEAVTQTAGLLLQRGRVHRFRTSLDFVDTRKTNELFTLLPQVIVDLESLWPERVTRGPVAANDASSVGRITSLMTGNTNLSWRHSQNWNLNANYVWSGCFGGTLEAYARLLYFQRYDVQVTPESGVVDQLRHPNGSAPNLLKIRSNFGASWSNRDFGFGMDGHYFHSRTLFVNYWPTQGSDHINPFWQFDAFVQADLRRWLPWKSSRYDLRAQVRVNNVFAAPYPKYVFGESSAGVQPYGDWRGRAYSVSLTATF